jgi:hypothetical protein
MPLSRKHFLAGTAGAALAAAGVYELVEQLGSAPARPVAAATLPRGPEQHLLGGIRVVRQDGVEVNVPPLHHQVVTLELHTGHDARSLKDAQSELEHALLGLERTYQATPAGLGMTVAWGLPYFRRYVPALAERYLPEDQRASHAKGKRTSVLLDAIRYPSDPHGAILEQNDAALLLRSDSLDHIARASKTLVDGLQLWRPTSIRRGFAGGGFDGGEGLPRQLAMAAGVRGADLIPHGAELFLGFTSTQRASLGPERIANIETLGYSDGGRDGYFRGGTAMHLSHLFEDLEGWYLTFDQQQRASTVFRPGQKVPEGVQAVRQDPKDVASVKDNVRAFRRTGGLGHSASIQTASRLAVDVHGADGTLYVKGTAVPQRADFNTLDNPFFWSANPDRDSLQPEPAAGLHFVVFTPTCDDFERQRLAMDGRFQGGVHLSLPAGDRQQGFNSVLTTTHRQNFIVPPRAHRSFPLAELL